MDASVLEQCRACITALKTIVLTLSDSDRQKGGVHHEHVNDELEKFSLWMGNIGALHRPESSMSLESRLREANDVLSHILELLADLNEVAGELLEIVSGKRDGEITSGLHGDSDEEDQNEETELLEEIDACITRLFRVSSLIRQAAPTDLFAKALSRNRYQFNDQFDIGHVGEKFPNLATEELSWLQQRLGRAITHRRHYLSYIQDHREKLEGILTHEGTPELVGATDSQAPTNHVPAMKLLLESSSRPSTFFTKASSLTPGHMTPQMLAAEEESDSASDTRSYTTITRSIDDDLDSSATVRIPKLDQLRTGPRKEVECPFCFRIKKFKNERVWRQHVFSDLRSYVCTFPKCDAPYFGDINEWFRHEMQTHRVSYTCRLCQSKTFQLRERYLSHVRKQHPNILEDGEQPVLYIARKPLDQIPAQECPCCSEWVDRLKERAAVASMPSDASDHILSVVPAVFKRHLASHLEQLALFAIPVTLAVEGDVASNVAIEGVGALSGVADLSSLAFDSSRPSSPASEGHPSDVIPITEGVVKAPAGVGSRDSTRSVTPSIVESAPQISIPYPAFLRLTRLEIRTKFEELEWEQRLRLGQSMQPADSEQPSQWTRCTGDEVKNRNRYANVDPYQSNRVKLKVPEGHNDYINASPIILKSTRSKTVTKFIVTQGPKADSFSHIWRMIWHETSSPTVILMLTQTYESGREKCFQYFPLSPSKPDLRVNKYDEFEDSLIHNVRLVSLENNEEVRSEVRELDMIADNESESKNKKIWHFLFGGWPDFSVPEGVDREALLKLIEISREKNADNSTNPRIVHCSSGVGRSGVFIALDWLLQELEEGSIDELPDDQDPVLYIVSKLRQQRMMMVQGEPQYSFLYEIIRQRWRERWVKLNPENAAQLDTQIGIEEPKSKKHELSWECDVSGPNTVEDEGGAHGG